MTDKFSKGIFSRHKGVDKRIFFSFFSLASSTYSL